jgi:MFS transporter, DHA3 family, tetracycline resistance protein
MRRADATRLYYVLQVILFMPTWVVMAVYLVRELHMSPLQLVLMGTAMEAAIFVFEVPTGVVADTYSRRLSLILGYLGMGVAWMAVGVVSSPAVVIALWAFWGFAYTFTSGADVAWITDEVGAQRAGSVLLQGSRIRYIGSVSGLVLQVAIGAYSLRAGVIAGGATTVVAGLVCIALMPETGFRRRPRCERGSAFAELRATAGTGFRYAWAAPLILLLAGVALFTGMSSEAFDRLKEAHVLRDVGLPAVGDLSAVVWFGILWLVGMALGFVATGRLIHRFQAGGGQRIARWLLLLTGAEMAALLVFALTGLPWLALVAMLGVFLARNLAGPLFTIWLNEQIQESSVRATVLSIAGQADAVGQAAGGPLLGVVGNVWGIRAALSAGSLVLAPALWLYGRAIRHDGEVLPTPAPESSAARTPA